jgi:nitrogenase molybdenum-iron protein alpha/beta subunit
MLNLFIIIFVLCCMWKVFSLSTKAVKGSFSTGFDIHGIAVKNDFIFTATKCGIIEVWLRGRVRKAASIKMAHAKITSLTSDMDETMLFAGSYDGKIKVGRLIFCNFVT